MEKGVFLQKREQVMSSNVFMNCLRKEIALGRLFPGCIINAFTGLQITGNLGVCIVKKGGD